MGDHMWTSYSRHRNNYVYDIDIHEVTAPAIAGRFFAHVVNMVRWEADQAFPVNAAGLQHQRGATPDEAFSRIDAAVAEWVTRQPR
jgi:hypothetical protein